MKLKKTIAKLYDCIDRLVLMLETELDQLSSSPAKSLLTAKPNLTDTIYKLVSLIVQLNKIDHKSLSEFQELSSHEDEQIIEYFLNKYSKKDN